jgi:hypothetical protein
LISATILVNIEKSGKIQTLTQFIQKNNRKFHLDESVSMSSTKNE